MFYGSVYCHPLCSSTHLKASVSARQEAVKVCGKEGNGQELATDKISPDTPTSAPFSLGALSSRTRIPRYWMLKLHLATRMPRRALTLSSCLSAETTDFLAMFTNLKKRIFKTKRLYGPSGYCREKQISIILSVLPIIPVLPSTCPRRPSQ